MFKIPNNFGWRIMELALATTVVMAILAGGTIFVLDRIAEYPDRHPDNMLAFEYWVQLLLHEITFPIKLAKLSLEEPNAQIMIPVYGLRISQVSDTWGAPRDGERSHEGQDMFAGRGTPVFSGTDGYVVRIRTSTIGGNYVNIAGYGARRYYYAHLDRVASGLRVGQWITTDTVIGFVGNTGNAVNTPTHLHFGMYEKREAINPYPLLVNRDW